MKIEFTKDEFKTLLDLVYAGNTLLNGMKKDDDIIEDYCKLEQKVYSLAEEFGLNDLVEYDQGLKEYVPTRTYEESGINDHIDNYDDTVFWEELTLRLARKDALNILCDQEPDMSKEALRELQIRLEDEYEKKFSEGGFADLKFIERT